MAMALAELRLCQRPQQREFSAGDEVGDAACG
jgi:hypothetical protein